MCKLFISARDAFPYTCLFLWFHHVKTMLVINSGEIGTALTGLPHCIAFRVGCIDE